MSQEFSLDAPSRLADWFGATESWRPAESLAEHYARLAAVTADDVRRVSSRVFARFEPHGRGRRPRRPRAAQGAARAGRLAPAAAMSAMATAAAAWPVPRVLRTSAVLGALAWLAFFAVTLPAAPTMALVERVVLFATLVITPLGLALALPASPDPASAFLLRAIAAAQPVAACALMASLCCSRAPARGGSRCRGRSSPGSSGCSASPARAPCCARERGSRRPAWCSRSCTSRWAARGFSPGARAGP